MKEENIVFLAALLLCPIALIIGIVILGTANT